MKGVPGLLPSALLDAAEATAAAAAAVAAVPFALPGEAPQAKRMPMLGDSAS